MEASREPIVVLGGGLAGSLTAASLERSLGASRAIILVADPEPVMEDSFYGGATAPDAYNFLRSAGLDEPTLIRKTGTSFSYGTHFKTWLSSTAWMQAHHAPLPVLEGAAMRHQLARFGLALEPLLVSAQAALAGRFAHPPSDPGSILSRAEYGYQFAVDEWTRLLTEALKTRTVRRIEARIADIEVRGGEIIAVRLSNGETLTGALYVDATGPSRRAVRAVGGDFREERAVVVAPAVHPTAQLGPPCRQIELTQAGWRARTFLQTAMHDLTVRSATDGPATPAEHQIAIGRCENAWIGNCVAVGHAAAVLEPLTPAPMMMVQRDIERLLALIPTPDGMEVERREFNRRYRDDIAHTALFHEAILRSAEAPDGEYWTEARAQAADPRLERKLAQFDHRGALVSYDLEPFNEEDWTILHFGAGRRPRHHDRQADAVPEADARRALGQIRGAIDQLIPRMPPHALYVGKLKQYLEKQAHG